MGQNTSKQYQEYYSTIDQKKELTVNGLDPFKVLNISNRETYTFDQLKNAYRQISIKVHPDKGGSKELFEIATECFRVLAEKLKYRAPSLPHELKKEAQRYQDKQYDEPPPISSYKDSGNFHDKFNRAFEENRLDDENDFGYGEKMVASTKSREDIDVPTLFKKEAFSEDKFNRMFDKVTISKNKEVIIYEEPEPLVLSDSLQFVELGEGKVNDFSTDSTRNLGLQYTDYMRAHTQTRLVDPRSVQERKQYKNVEAFEADREAKSKQVFSQAEKQKIEQRRIEKERQEEERLERLKSKDYRIEQHYNKAKTLLR